MCGAWHGGRNEPSGFVCSQKAHKPGNPRPWKFAIDRHPAPAQRSVPETRAKMRAILLAFLTSAVLGTATAQTLDQQWAWCRDSFSDRLIRACSAVIRSGRQSPEDLARAFFNRGRALADEGQL